MTRRDEAIEAYRFAVRELAGGFCLRDVDSVYGERERLADAVVRARLALEALGDDEEDEDDGDE